MQNYVELMKIRISDNVKVDVKFNILPNADTKVAPLLFISLIKNAFKHGISYSTPSFINIRLDEHEDGTIECKIENSYFPKDEYDKSGYQVLDWNLSKSGLSYFTPIILPGKKK